jgi:DNA-binding transcriptional LysR family regulator
MLAAFDAAARTGSMAKAARELNVTHGAISRQIHALETQLGVPLFLRTARGLQLTEVGESYAADVHTVIQTLHGASLKIISNPKGSTVDLAVLPTFETRWLIPRLPAFLAENPGITVNFVAHPTRAEIVEDGIDAAIYSCTPDWPGADSALLIAEYAYPVCSPILLKRSGATPESAVRDLPLLALKSRPDAWANWFAAGRLEMPRGRNTMQLEQFSALAHAAVAGLGVALLPRFLIGTELERGTLVPVSDRASDAETAYYLVTPKARQNYEPVLRFRSWLLDTIAAEQRQAAHLRPHEPGGRAHPSHD